MTETTICLSDRSCISNGTGRVRTLWVKSHWPEMKTMHRSITICMRIEQDTTTIDCPKEIIKRQLARIAETPKHRHTCLQWSGRTEQLHRQLKRDIVKSILKLVWEWIEIKKFKEHFNPFLVAVRSKYCSDFDLLVPNKTYRKKSQFWRILHLLGSSWPLETWRGKNPSHWDWERS